MFENKILELSSHKNFGNISYKQILTIITSFILGIAVILILQNAFRSELITLSTLDIISFLFSIALSSVSIFLALTAIMLSRSSEKAVLERSDDSIRLQNETYMKTIEALKKIELSTGFTEKRMDDIFTKILVENLPRKEIDSKINPEDEI